MGGNLGLLLLLDLLPLLLMDPLYWLVAERMLLAFETVFWLSCELLPCAATALPPLPLPLPSTLIAPEIETVSTFVLLLLLLA